jgi:hypothetical protein
MGFEFKQLRFRSLPVSASCISFVARIAILKVILGWLAAVLALRKSLRQFGIGGAFSISARPWLFSSSYGFFLPKTFLNLIQAR